MVAPISQIPTGEAPANGLSGPALARAVMAALDWWREAGVDGDWVDAPQDWLAKARPARAVRAAAPDGIAAPALPGGGAALPGDLAAFAQWWMNEPDLAPAGMQRIAPAGPEAPALMVVVPMPEAEDAERLLSGPAGRLLDGFLAAAGLSREQIYIASALPVRIAAPDWVALAEAGLGRVLIHHVTLVRPQRLILFGQNGISTLMGNGSPNNPTHLQSINHGDGMVPALWSYDLETIVARPALKAGLWSRWLDWMPADTH
jgi:DNA polymerase